MDRDTLLRQIEDLENTVERLTERVEKLEGEDVIPELFTHWINIGGVKIERLTFRDDLEVIPPMTLLKDTGKKHREHKRNMYEVQWKDQYFSLYASPGDIIVRFSTGKKVDYYVLDNGSSMVLGGLVDAYKDSLADS